MQEQYVQMEQRVIIVGTLEKIIRKIPIMVIIAVPIIIQEITIAIMRTTQEIIAIIPTTIKTIPQQYTKPSNKTTASKKPTKQRSSTSRKNDRFLEICEVTSKEHSCDYLEEVKESDRLSSTVCAKSNFKKGTIERKFKQKVTKTKVRPVKSKKKYYVRMRPYTKSGSKTYYGKWSKVKSVKIK